MIYTYLQIFILNPVICILAIWILFRLYLHRLVRGLNPEKTNVFLKKILPPEQIADELVPIAEEINDALPDIVPRWIRLFGRKWYKKVRGLLTTLSDKETMREIIETILEGDSLSNIMTKNLTKQNPGIMQNTLTSTLRPWIILTGLLLGILTGLLQLLFLL